jgi:small subunit ribosomal protein S3
VKGNDSFKIDSFLEKIKFLFPKTKIKVISVRTKTRSFILAHELAGLLEKRVAPKRAIQEITQELSNEGFKGFRIQISGRLNGNDIARRE